MICSISNLNFLLDLLQVFFIFSDAITAYHKQGHPKFIRVGHENQSKEITHQLLQFTFITSPGSCVCPSYLQLSETIWNRLANFGHNKILQTFSAQRSWF